MALRLEKENKKKRAIHCLDVDKKRKQLKNESCKKSIRNYMYG